MAEPPREIVVTDVRIPFWSLVALIIKVTLAAIPAVLILSLLWMLGVAAIIAFTGWSGPY